MKHVLVPVTERALLQRINRKLAPKYETVKKAKGRTLDNLGKFYRLDTYRNSITDSHIDLANLGRELGALAEWEKLT